MSESSDTSSIDEKKKDSSTFINSDYVSNIGGFLLSLIILFILIAVYYTGSGMILYTCKLAQSNILPTDKNCSPYTDTKPDIQPIKSNIFSINTNPPLSMKINFPYNEYNSKNYILDMFHEYRKESNSYFLANYIISMIETVTQFNYSVINNLMNMLNGLPEILLVIFGPIIIAFASTFLFITDHIYLIYLWFAKMSWFFKTNTNDSGTGIPKWENVTLFTPFNYGCAIGLIILFTILFFFSLPVISIFATLSMVWCIISCITYKAEMLDKTVTVITVIQDIFKYYKSIIMGIISFFVIVSAFGKLGPIPGIISIVTFTLIYFGIISIDLFKPTNKDNLTALASDSQAKKTCSFKEPTKGKHGFLYNLLIGQKGGNITKELKEIGKKLASK
jgi:hypothetical protein